MPATDSTIKSKGSFSDRFLNTIERLGNKLPDSFFLFLTLFCVLAVVSSLMAWAKVTVTLPGTTKATPIKGLFTGEGLTWLTSNLGPNYLGFPPLVTVLPILLAVGMAEKTGFLVCALKALLKSAPRWVLPYFVGFVGVIGSVMADSAFVIVPPLAAILFQAARRHPVAGLLGGFAATGAGYSTSVVVTSLDALFAGITTAVTKGLPNPGQPVTPVSNLYFNIIASVILGLVAGLLIDKVLEPRMWKLKVPTTETRTDNDVAAGHMLLQTQESAPAPKGVTAELTSLERKGLRWATVVMLAAAVGIVVAVAIPNSPWRNEAGHYLPKSPLLNSVVFIVFTLFLLPGLVYGKIVGAIQQARDVTRIFTLALRDMLGFLVLAFILGQFIALFSWSNIGQWIAVVGSEGLRSIGLTGFPAIIGFIILCSILNLFIVSGSSMWALMAAVFVPMFSLIGYQPGFIQAAFRVGDSATQIITPLNPYMIVLLGMLRRYEKDAGFGTMMARMLPFVAPFWLTWTLLLLIWFLFDLPLGPGNSVFLPMR